MSDLIPNETESDSGVETFFFVFFFVVVLFFKSLLQAQCLDVIMFITSLHVDKQYRIINVTTSNVSMSQFTCT